MMPSWQKKGYQYDRTPPRNACQLPCVVAAAAAATLHRPPVPQSKTAGKKTKLVPDWTCNSSCAC